jgi:hypothetical protein
LHDFERKSNGQKIIKSLKKTDYMEIGHLDIGEWGVLGVIKKVKRSYLTFPDAHILVYLMIYII